MKLKKLLSEATPQTQISNRLVPAGHQVSNAMQEPDPRVNPIGGERLPKVSSVRNTSLKLKYDIEQTRNTAELHMSQAKALLAQGDVATGGKHYDAACNMLMNIIDRHVLSGLRTKSFYVEQERAQDIESQHGSSYFVIAGDVDNMKWLNDKSGLDHDGTDAVLAHVGELMSKYVETVPNTKGYHPHGDEFFSFTYLLDDNKKPLSPEIRQKILAQLVNGMIRVSNELTSTGWKATQDMEPVQATMSFAISSNSALASKLLRLTKTKDVKYFIMIDENISNAHNLEARKDLFSHPLQSVMVATSAQINQFGQPGQSSQPPMQPVTEGKNDELEFTKTVRGPVFLKCNPSNITPEDEEKINQAYTKKQAYLAKPADYTPRGMPLAEKYRGKDRNA